MSAAGGGNRARERRYWDRQAKRYDLSMRLLGGPMPRMLQRTAEAVGGAERVLEVAAGTGLVTVSLARSAGDVVATDYAPAMVELLKRRVREEGVVNVTCERADLYALRFEPASFDAVVAANVLHLVPDLEAALTSLRRVLRPGGRLIVPTFCHDETAKAAIVSRLLALTGFPGQRRFTASSLRAALIELGLQRVQIEVISGLIPLVYAEGTHE